MAQNERGAGRKPTLSEETLQEIRRRHEAGETITALAQVYGVSRQTLHNYLKEPKEGHRRIYRSLKQWQRLNRDFPGVDVQDYMIRMDYMNGDECCSRLLVSFQKRQVVAENTTDVPFHRAFGMKAKPTWEDFEEFLEDQRERGRAPGSLAAYRRNLLKLYSLLPDGKRLTAGTAARTARDSGPCAPRRTAESIPHSVPGHRSWEQAAPAAGPFFRQILIKPPSI